MLDSEKLTAEVGEWHANAFPGATPEDVLVKLNEEVGELCAARLKGRHADGAVRTVWRSKECDAIGDIMIVLAAYCYKQRISIASAVTLAWEEVRDRSTDRLHNR